MNKTHTTLILTILLTSLNIYAVGQAALPTLMLEIGARSSGFGGATTALSDGVQDMFNNPAALGSLYEKNHTYVEFAHYGEDLLPEFHLPDLYHTTNMIGLFTPRMKNDLSFGVGFYTNRINFGLGEVYDTTDRPRVYYNSFDDFKIMTLSAAYKNDFRIGLSYKDIYSDLGYFYIDSILTQALSNTYALDIGMQASHNFKFAKNPFSIEPSIGISCLNFGPDVYYARPEYADPLPTTILIGTAIKINFLEYFSLTSTYNLSQEIARNERLGKDGLDDASTHSGGVEMNLLGLLSFQNGWMYDKAGSRHEMIQGLGLSFDLKRTLAIIYRLRNSDFNANSEPVRAIYDKKIKLSGITLSPNLRLSINTNIIHGIGELGSARNNQQRFDFSLGF